MRCIHKTVNPIEKTNLDHLRALWSDTGAGSEPDWLFFDIETTGLSREKNRIYLVGTLLCKEGQGLFFQWLAQSPEEERAVLSAFLTFLLRLEKSTVLVHFNGTRFDLPFFQTRCRLNSLDSQPLLTLPDIDLYKEIKKNRHLLGLSSCRQKSIEDFLHIKREDRFTGGELIPVFHRYCKNLNSREEQLLLLHNEEDVQNMPRLTSIFTCLAFLKGDFRWIQYEESCYMDWEGTQQQELFVTYHSCQHQMPFPVIIRYDSCRISCRGNELTLRLPLISDEMKYFFEDYKNYYYLPIEDQAIHKSVAVYVDSAFRQKATAQNCYARVSGLFFPAVRSGLKPCFYRTYEEKQGYFLWDGKEQLCGMSLSDFFEEYLNVLLKS